MIISASLTPLSQSILFQPAQAAHRRYCRALSLDLPAVSPPVDPALLWDQRPLASVITAVWGHAPEDVGRLLAVEAPSRVEKNKPGQRVKMARALLRDIPESQKRLRRWYEGVNNMDWHQAELLQVMEEIEPRIEDALYDLERAAAVAVGSYLNMLALLQKHVKQASKTTHLDLVAGLAAPDAAMITDLADGMDIEAWLERYGQRGDQEMELAAPRLAEALPPAFTGAKLINKAWNPTQARSRREQAVRDALSQAGFLSRSTLRKAIEIVQDALVLHAQAYETLALMLAATRRWSLAAAHEGQRDGRLDGESDIFLLELEEIKQMMTGEWHDRALVQKHVIMRRQARKQTQSPPSTKTQALGVAGTDVQGGVYSMAGLNDLTEMPLDAIALVAQTSPAWSPLFLKAGGVICSSGNWLSHTAIVARAGGMPALVARPQMSQIEQRATISLDPAQN